MHIMVSLVLPKFVAIFKSKYSNTPDLVDPKQVSLFVGGYSLNDILDINTWNVKPKE
jgi:hypothetical protein